MPIKYIGRTTDFKGKPLWEILANLKNFGVGRIVIRNMEQRFPEPSFYRILKVAALAPPSDENPEEERKIAVLVERTFRGLKFAEPIQMLRTTYKADYRLVPKDEEAKYMQEVKRPVTVLPRTLKPPPILKEILIRQMKAAKKPIPEDLQFPIVYSPFENKLCRLGEEGEVPPIDLERNALGTPASPSLYANIKEDTLTESACSTTQ